MNKGRTFYGTAVLDLAQEKIVLVEVQTYLCEWEEGLPTTRYERTCYLTITFYHEGHWGNWTSSRRAPSQPRLRLLVRRGKCEDSKSAILGWVELEPHLKSTPRISIPHSTGYRGDRDFHRIVIFGILINGIGHLRRERGRRRRSRKDSSKLSRKDQGSGRWFVNMDEWVLRTSFRSGCWISWVVSGVRKISSPRLISSLFSQFHGL